MNRRLSRGPIVIAACLWSILTTSRWLAQPFALAQPAEPTAEPQPPRAYLPIVIAQGQDDLLHVRAYFSDRSMLDALASYADLTEPPTHFQRTVFQVCQSGVLN